MKQPWLSRTGHGVARLPGSAGNGAASASARTLARNPTAEGEPRFPDQHSNLSSGREVRRCSSASHKRVSQGKESRVTRSVFGVVAWLLCFVSSPVAAQGNLPWAEYDRLVDRWCAIAPLAVGRTFGHQRYECSRVRT